MGPASYREMKKRGKLFPDGSPVNTSEQKGVIIYSRWHVKSLEWFALVKHEDDTEKYFWHSELSACSDPSV